MWIAGWLAAILPASSVWAQESSWEFTGNLGVESRWFWEEPQWPGQAAGIGGSLYSNLQIRWQNDRQRIGIEPFWRLDSVDSHRSHWDLREAYWALDGDDWEILLGVSRVFWGVTESRHLVDIVNQTDLVEDPDREQKLGQPMARLTLLRDWGDLELFVMPYFRERTFPGSEGRFRSPISVETDGPIYESKAGSSHLDFALRYSHFIGDADIGLSFFRGTGRTPKLIPSDHSEELLPYYHQISQVGMDLQYTLGPWLWKLETIVRRGLDDTFAAAVAGLEYTFFGVRDSDADVGLLVEYLRDGRGPSEPVTPFDNDLFIGSRVALNDLQDSNVLLGLVMDMNEQEWFLNLEAERRLGQDWVVEGRLRVFHGNRQINQLSAFDRDDYAQLNLVKYF